jgi:hypothetical protein
VWGGVWSMAGDIGCKARIKSGSRLNLQPRGGPFPLPPAHLLAYVARTEINMSILFLCTPSGQRCLSVGPINLCRRRFLMRKLS